MKGLVLAGGNGSRLYPLTISVSKQLLPVYDKPLIYYSLSTLMLAGIKDIAIITKPQDQALFRAQLGDGSQWGISLSYIIQDEPRGLAHSFIIAEDFIGDDSVCLILGDNIFYGQGLSTMLQNACKMHKHGGQIFAYSVTDPQHYGVVEFDPQSKAINIEEKPGAPKSSYAVTGLYFYDNTVIDVAKGLKPSGRGELEITDINNHYLRHGQLHVEQLGRGYCWLDAGTHEALLNAGNYVETIEKRQGMKIACLEEIAWRMGFIGAEQLSGCAHAASNENLKSYLLRLLESS